MKSNRKRPYSFDDKNAVTYRVVVHAVNSTYILGLIEFNKGSVVVVSCSSLFHKKSVCQTYVLFLSERKLEKKKQKQKAMANNECRVPTSIHEPNNRVS